MELPGISKYEIRNVFRLQKIQQNNKKLGKKRIQEKRTIGEAFWGWRNP